MVTNHIIYTNTTDIGVCNDLATTIVDDEHVVYKTHPLLFLHNILYNEEVTKQWYCVCQHHEQRHFKHDCAALYTPGFSTPSTVPSVQRIVNDHKRDNH